MAAVHFHLEQCRTSVTQTGPTVFPSLGFDFSVISAVEHLVEFKQTCKY